MFIFLLPRESWYFSELARASGHAACPPRGWGSYTGRPCSQQQLWMFPHLFLKQSSELWVGGLGVLISTVLSHTILTPSPCKADLTGCIFWGILITLRGFVCFQREGEVNGFKAVSHVLRCCGLEVLAASSRVWDVGRMLWF